MNKDKLLQLYELKRLQLINQAREDFWTFCKIFSPKFPDGRKIFRDDVTYLRELAHELQNLIRGDKLGICISMPPRHAKTLLTSYFLRWYIGNYYNNKIIHVSYSLRLVNELSRQIKNTFQDNFFGDYGLQYSDIFPLQIANDTRSKTEWKIKGSGQITYKCATFNTAVTGSGCQLLVVDDPVKDAQEAQNQGALQDKWDQFKDTFLSRREAGAKIIIIQTRWSKYDLIGQIQQSDLSDQFTYIVKTVQNEAGKMLNEDFLNEKDYHFLESIISDHIFRANYYQETVDLKNTLYTNIQFYNKDKLQTYGLKKVCFLDPSAKGTDYTAAVAGWLDNRHNKIYVTNIFYDNTPFSKVEQQLYTFLKNEKLDELVCESNGAFSILANNIRNFFRENGIRTRLIEFTQTKNKEARILNCAKLLQESIFFQEDFKTAHKEAYQHLAEFKSDIKLNKHDDLEDALTALTEQYIVNNYGRDIQILKRMF